LTGVIEEIEDLNDLIALFTKETKDYSFFHLRNLFFALYLNEFDFSTKQKIIDFIHTIKKFGGNLPSDDMIKRSIFDEKTQALLHKLKRTKINEIRNKASHKHAYRPSLEEIESLEEEAREIVFGLQVLLNIKPLDLYLNPF
jgi:hypothetical protein